MKLRPFRSRRSDIILALVALALLATSSCARQPPSGAVVATHGIPIEVARLIDVRGGTGVAAPTAGWFQRRMGEELARAGFTPRLLRVDEQPSGSGLSIIGRLHELPSTIEPDGPPGEVSFSAQLLRDGKPIFQKNYQDRVWLGWPQMREPSIADSALREATDRTLRSFAEDVRKAVRETA